MNASLNARAALVSVLLLALMRAAANDPEYAAGVLSANTTHVLPMALSATAWAHIAKQGALKQMPQAAGWAREAWKLWDAAHKPGQQPPWSEELIAWHARAALRLDIGRGEAQEYMDLYFSRYTGVRDFMQATREQARNAGYVETVFGRRLYLTHIRARNQAQRAGAERAAINAPMQGTAADIIKRAMIDVDRWLLGRDDAAMLLQVHDELVLEVREDRVDEIAAGLRERMSAAAQLDVPLDVDVGHGANWDAAH